MEAAKAAPLKLAWDFLAEARRQLEAHAARGDELALRPACEKGWGAVAQALMAASGKPIRTHREFGEAASELFRRTGDRNFLTGEAAGEYLHSAGFYHGLPTAELASNSLDLVEGLLKAAEQLLGGKARPERG